MLRSTRDLNRFSQNLKEAKRLLARESPVSSEDTDTTECRQRLEELIEIFEKAVSQELKGYAK